MCKISGKPVHDLWNSICSLRLTLWQSLAGSVRLWVNSALSTTLYQVDPQSYPQVFSPTHLCLNTCFTQFPQHLLLLTPDKK